MGEFLFVVFVCVLLRFIFVLENFRVDRGNEEEGKKINFFFECMFVFLFVFLISFDFFFLVLGF